MILLDRISFTVSFIVLASTMPIQAETGQSSFESNSASSSQQGGAPEDVAITRQLIEQYAADLETLRKRYRVPLDSSTNEKRRNIITDRQKQLQTVDFDALDPASQIDYLLLRSQLEYQLEKDRLAEQRDQSAAVYLPYAEELVAFCKIREEVEPAAASDLAKRLDIIAVKIERLVKELSKPVFADANGDTETRLKALRAAEIIDKFRDTVKESHRFYLGYDPAYTWWAKSTGDKVIGLLEEHRKVLREKVVGIPDNDNETIVGLPIGEAGLAIELKHEWIAHSPSELIELAEREMKWCDQRMLESSRELGFGDDWHKAMEFVKSRYVEPGKQPALVHSLALDAIRFLESNDLVTVPSLAATGWRVSMMSPEQQRVNPYFLGGDEIIVSYPVDAMDYDEKMMSMRSNNEHFVRATVHHELIPGHHLQYYMLPRYRPYRSIFETPFWIEGWALYWEMMFWDLGYARNAEDRVGMLFWRKHRCARIIFSLNYHLGRMTPDECVQYLIDQVGHEPAAAKAEVRRSVMGDYGALYQAAYMLGGLQLRALHEELVQNGQMTNRQFHDAVLHEHSIPIELLRYYLKRDTCSADQQPNWRFIKESKPN